MTWTTGTPTKEPISFRLPFGHRLVIDLTVPLCIGADFADGDRVTLYYSVGDSNRVGKLAKSSSGGVTLRQVSRVRFSMTFHIARSLQDLLFVGNQTLFVPQHVHINDALEVVFDLPGPHSKSPSKPSDYDKGVGGLSVISPISFAGSSVSQPSSAEEEKPDAALLRIEGMSSSEEDKAYLGRPDEREQGTSDLAETTEADMS